jgi:mRNA interferase MazF
MSMADPCRGEVWLADLGTGRGREQAGQRPALVLSIDGFNASPAVLRLSLRQCPRAQV